MKRYISIILFLILTALRPALPAEDGGDVFLSLTKRYENIKDLPTNVSVIDQDKIEHSATKTLGEILDGELSVSTGKYGSFGASNTTSIRGSTAEQVLVLVDGRRINKISKGDVELNEVPLDAIERIEIIRGGASAVYGTNAIGGVINLITKKGSPNSPVFDFGASAGSFNTREYTTHLNVSRDKISGLVSASKQQSGGWRENSDYDAHDFFFRLGYDLDKKGQLDFSGSIFRNESGIPGNAVDAASSPLVVDKYDGSIELKASTPDARQKNYKDYARFEYKNITGPGTLVATVYGSDEKLKYTVPSWAMDAQYDSVVFGSEAKYLLNSGLTFGAEWWEERYKQLDLAFDLTKLDNSRVNSAGFVYYKAAFNKFTLIPSFRYDNSSIFGSVSTLKLSAVFKANDAWKISANYGRSWRAPTFNDLYWPTEITVFSGTTYITKGDAALKPEYGTSADIGFEYEKDRIKGVVTFFNTVISDMIIWRGAYDGATNTYTYIPRNVSNARDSGAEASLRHKINSFMVHELSYSYLWAEDTDTKTLLDYRPRNSARYSVKFMSVSGTRANIDFEYVSSQRTEVNPVTDELPGYLIVNLKISRKIHETELWVKADNVTDKKYQTRLGYPIPGAVYSAGITVKFWD